MSYLKRLMKEKEENKNGFEYFYIQPIANDIYNWHFTLKGVEGSSYENGLYHGYFEIPNDYPLSPPNIYFLNENGRYKINTKICMNITSYHKEEWSPAWTLRTMMQAVNAHFVVEDNGIGSLKLSADARKKLALSSREYKCNNCGPIEKISQTFFK